MHGEMAEWSNAAVLKTVEGHTSGGSNPSFSAKKTGSETIRFFYALKPWKACFPKVKGHKKAREASAASFRFALQGLPLGS